MGKRAHTSFCATGGNCWCKTEAIEKVIETHNEAIAKTFAVPATVKETRFEPVDNVPESKIQQVQTVPSEKFLSVGDTVRLITKYNKNQLAELGERGLVKTFALNGTRAVVYFPESDCMPDVPIECLVKEQMLTPELHACNLGDREGRAGANFEATIYQYN